MQSVGIFQYNIFSQLGYSSKKYSICRDITVQNIQPVTLSSVSGWLRNSKVASVLSVCRQMAQARIQAVEDPKPKTPTSQNAVAE
jgi:hypothetical protein